MRLPNEDNYAAGILNIAICDTFTKIVKITSIHMNVFGSTITAAKTFVKLFFGKVKKSQQGKAAHMAWR